MLKYAGVEIGGIPDPDGRLEEMLRQWWHQDGIRDYTHPAHNVAGIDHLPIPAQPDVQPPKLNTLVWPNGASRWGEFHTFVTKSQLDAIYKAVDTVTPVFQKLEILPAADKDSLGLNLKVAPMMYMLPPRVVCRHSGGELYLLSLVDKRFYWWQRVAAAPSAPATWAALLTALLTAVDEPTASIEAVDSAYGTPDADRWNVGYKPLPLLIDAACRTVGMRLVLQIGGTDVVIRGAASAIGVLDTAWNVYKDEVLTGGRLTLEDMALGLPETVRVVFPGDTPVTEDYSLQADGGTSWEAAYQGVVGAVAFVGADMPATAADVDRTAYATAAGIDFYEWCNSPVDATFRGLAGWAPTGLEDRIEWVHERQRVVTRVYRLPSHDRNLYLGDNCCATAAETPTDPTVPGSPPTCDGKKWWKQLRSDSVVAFDLSVTAKGGACNCADDTYTSTASFNTSAWAAADQITICTVAYDVSLTKPGGVPTLTLTPSGGGTAVSVAAECYGDGWADFTFPGDIANEDICTDPVAEGCDGDNGFTIRAQCICGTENNYNGPGWYVLAVTFPGAGNWGDAVNLTEDPGCGAFLCPGGPYADQATALANDCFEEPECIDPIVVPDDLEVEFFDGTGAAVPLNGLVADMTLNTTNSWGRSQSSSLGCWPRPAGFGGTGDFFIVFTICVNVPTGYFFQINDLPSSGCGSSFTFGATGYTGDGATASIVVTGTGPTFEATFTDMPASDSGGPNGVLSAVIRAKYR